jgi:hypothetical protein
MVTLKNILSMLLVERKEIDIRKLPSQGYFYPDDMTIKIKKAEIEDIFNYEQRISKHNLIKSIECIKDIVQKNISFNSNYSFIDLKSVDIIFLFLEIVKFTRDKDLMVSYVDITGESKKIPFGPEYFNYFDFEPFTKYYDISKKEMVIYRYRFSFPSIGIENSLSRYLTNITDNEKLELIKNISYDFLFFLTGKNFLTDNEIDNLIQIFNFDLDEEEKLKINNIVKKFNPILSYSLKHNGLIIEMKSSMNLHSIWNF